MLPLFKEMQRRSFRGVPWTTMKPFVARYFFKDLIGESYAFVANSCLTEVLRNASRECSGEMAISRQVSGTTPEVGDLVVALASVSLSLGKPQVCPEAGLELEGGWPAAPPEPFPGFRGPRPLTPRHWSVAIPPGKQVYLKFLRPHNPAPFLSFHHIL